MKIQGYIGGDIAHALQQAYPDYEYTFLVRNEDRAKPVRARYPDANLVYGSLDDSAVIEKAASEADIVIRECPADWSALGMRRSSQGL